MGGPMWVKGSVANGGPVIAGFAAGFRRCYNKWLVHDETMAGRLENHGDGRPQRRSAHGGGHQVERAPGHGDRVRHGARDRRAVRAARRRRGDGDPPGHVRARQLRSGLGDREGAARIAHRFRVHGPRGRYARPNEEPSPELAHRAVLSVRRQRGDHRVRPPAGGQGTRGGDGRRARAPWRAGRSRGPPGAQVAARGSPVEGPDAERGAGAQGPRAAALAGDADRERERRRRQALRLRRVGGLRDEPGIPAPPTRTPSS